MDSSRRTAHYKPNIWSYDYFESLVSNDKVPLCRAQLQRLKEDFIHVFDQATDASKLRMFDDVQKLGLSNLFDKEIVEALDVIASRLNMDPSSIEDLGTAALCFRLLRHHGFIVSQGLFTDFLDKEGKVGGGEIANVKGLIELYEASYLAVKDENHLIMAEEFSRHCMKRIHHDSSDEILTKRVVDSLEVPLHWRVQWFDVRQRIDEYALDVVSNPALLELAKRNFNMVQSLQKKDLRDLTMWWRNLGLIENISFARDRLVESFLWTVGVAFGPQYSSLRKCLTKVVTFVLVLDDLYDIYGSIDELMCFTDAVERWSSEEIHHLPECMNICFRALNRTTNEIAEEIKNETGCLVALPYLRQAWADFCKALFIEAQWYNKGHTPSLEEYLNSAWISSCGPLLSLVIFLMARNNPSEDMTDEWDAIRDLVYYSSVVNRLWNDLGTSAAELERGDSPSSILCYMKEANMTEEAARRRIRGIIASAWRKINGEFVKQVPSLVTPANLIINTSRVCHFIYHDGDGFGVQDGDTKTKIKRVLVEAFSLD